jgi:hypothetical protein
MVDEIREGLDRIFAAASSRRERAFMRRLGFDSRPA